MKSFKDTVIWNTHPIKHRQALTCHLPQAWSWFSSTCVNPVSHTQCGSGEAGKLPEASFREGVWTS